MIVFMFKFGGFNFFLLSFQDELGEVIDLKNPDVTPAAERREKRLEAEAAKFDSDHYL